MKQNKTHFRVYFNLFFLSGLVLFFASCARENSSVSYNSEKLRKQSLEIENSKPSTESNAASKIEKNESTINVSEGLKHAEKAAVKAGAIAADKSSNATESKTKISPVQKLIVKKIAKKMNADKTSALEKNLKFAIIFGIVGLIFMLFGYPIWLVGAILLVVGLIFLLLWVLEQ